MQALMTVLMLSAEGWFLCAVHQHATWRCHMRKFLFLVFGARIGQVLN